MHRDHQRATASTSANVSNIGTEIMTRCSKLVLRVQRCVAAAQAHRWIAPDGVPFLAVAHARQGARHQKNLPGLAKAPSGARTRKLSDFVASPVPSGLGFQRTRNTLSPKSVISRRPMATPSAQINAEIFNLGPRLLEAVCAEIREKGTWSNSKAQRVENREKLEAKINQVLQNALPRSLDHQGLWQAIWPRITYARTVASKASREIKSMQAVVPLFRDLDHYDPDRYRFDADEWERFVTAWKKRYPKTTHKNAWLERSKRDPDWSPSTYFKQGMTTPDVWQILTKDARVYPALEFSAHPAKVAKYLKVADFLHRHKVAGGTSPMDFFIAGEAISTELQTGETWRSERSALKRIHGRLTPYVGPITSLHILMDMGFKTIKPDRVMVYLFSQLGWLQTLPPSLRKEQVLASYARKSVIEEMSIRADIFADSLHQRGYTQPHRRLDIWLVKYGQLADDEFGITQNLQEAGNGISGLLQRLKDEPHHERSTPEQLSAEETASRWPAPDFTAVSTGNATTLGKVSSRKMLMPRKDAEDIFMAQWRVGRETRPDIYPAGKPGLTNDQKEKILSKIERGMDSAEAFLSVLRKSP